MAHQSDPHLLVAHALHVKGFGTVEDRRSAHRPRRRRRSSRSCMPDAEQGLALFQRSPRALDADRRGQAGRRRTSSPRELQRGRRRRRHARGRIPRSSALNEQFKELCGDWQLFPGEGDQRAPNDHSDAAYDADGRRAARRARSQRARRVRRVRRPALARYAPYAPRLTTALEKVKAGDHKLFTGRDVRLVPRRVDGAARRPHPDARHRPSRRRELLMATLRIGPHRDGDAVRRRGRARPRRRASRCARWLQANGNDGLVIAGTTGEAPTLTDDEKLDLWAAVGRGGDDPGRRRHGLERHRPLGRTSRRRRRSSASPACLVVCPYYNRPSQAGIEAHFRAVAAATDAAGDRLRHPDPHRPQGRPPTSCCAWPARCRTSSALKDAAGNPAETARAASPRRPSDFEVYSGDDVVDAAAARRRRRRRDRRGHALVGRRARRDVSPFEKGDVVGARASRTPACSRASRSRPATTPRTPSRPRR